MQDFSAASFHGRIPWQALPSRVRADLASGIPSSRIPAAVGPLPPKLLSLRDKIARAKNLEEMAALFERPDERTQVLSARVDWSCTNKQISFKARGVLAYLLSLPDDWAVSIEHLATVSPGGRVKVQTAIKELAESGYMELELLRDPQTGQVKGKQWMVYDASNIPTDKQVSRPSVSPSIGKPATTNERGENRNRERKEKPEGAAPPLASTGGTEQRTTLGKETVSDETLKTAFEWERPDSSGFVRDQVVRAYRRRFERRGLDTEVDFKQWLNSIQGARAVMRAEASEPAAAENDSDDDESRPETAVA